MSGPSLNCKYRVFYWKINNLKFAICIFFAKWTILEIELPTLKNHSISHKVGICQNQFHVKIQGDPNQNLLIKMAITLEVCISDPILVKPIYVLEASVS